MTKEIQELVKVTTNDRGEQLVSGRELHGFLEVRTKYTQWFDDMTQYGFIENVDYSTLTELSEKKEGSRFVKRTIINHAMTIDMAKEISMIQRTPKGKQARQYFIQVEKEYRQSLQSTPSLSDSINAIVQHIKKAVEEDILAKSYTYNRDRVIADIRNELTELTEMAFTPAPQLNQKYESLTSSQLAKQLGFTRKGRCAGRDLNRELAEIGVLEAGYDNSGKKYWKVAPTWKSQGIAVERSYMGSKNWFYFTEVGVQKITELAAAGAINVH
ncbi:antA/AntB antirepressor family protein [Enterococcus innesii]|uniref:antA/AntB antirepressor family protein n=1 Tax=Enterococcus innesii TaxID=2839759 RepID=UPI003F696277